MNGYSIKDRIFALAAAVTVSAALSGCGSAAAEGTELADAQPAGTLRDAEKSDFRIVSSFYPMQVLTLNLVEGIDGVTAVSMSAPDIGCIHDHTFSTEDLRKIEDADVFIENGLGLETFNDRIKTAYPDTAVIEAASQVTDAPADEDEVNGHVWTSIDDYILEVKHVSSELQALDPAHRDSYAGNERIYTEKLEKLKSDNSAVLEKLRGKKALVLDETLPSFCVFAGMDTITIETDHEQEALSAGDIAKAVDEMKEQGIGMILISTDSDSSAAEAVAAETGAKIYRINSCMTGEENADAYLTQMQESFDILSEIE